MNTTSITNTNDGQTICLPHKFRMTGKEVYIKKIGQSILLTPKDNPWESLINSLDQFSDDFMNERNQPPVQDRESF